MTFNGPSISVRRKPKHDAMQYAIAAIALALTSNLAAAQTTWYVDVHGAAPGSGTASSPYASIQYAHDATTTHALDTLLVAPGVYDEHLFITKSVTIRSSGGPLATVLAPSTVGTGTVVQLNNALFEYDHTVVDGFAIRKNGTAFASCGVRARSGTIRNCIIIGNGVGFGAFSQYDMEIDNCLVTGNYMGITEDAYIALVYGRNNISSGNSYEDAHFQNGNCLAYTCVGISFIFSGAGNIQADPQLRDLPGHDFHLLSNSPCIDSGDPTSPLDPDGSRADMGPLPFDANYAPFAIYCTAKTNSFGCVPTIGISGTASASSSLACSITCTNELNNKLGLLFYGFTAQNAAYQGGYLCVASPVHRTPLIDSGGSAAGDDCSGVYSFDFNALIRSGADPALEPNAQVFAQFWSRDPNASFTTNRSDALSLRVAP